MQNNTDLYESDEVVAKYAANTTRVRSLNNPEKYLIDRYGIKNKSVLVIGGGAGRVPANLLLYGNKVLSIDRSQKLTEAAKNNFPHSKFADLEFREGDASDLPSLPDSSFDVVLFPMNSIDYIDSKDMRDKALREAVSKLKPGGLLAFSSHNKLGYFFSPKIRMNDRTLASFSGDYKFMKESVVGGGNIFKGNPDFIISDTEKLTGAKYQGFLVDSRNKFERFLSRNLFTSKFYFPYLLYVFKKEA